MPTILRLGALRVVIYPNDHRPTHVHVIGPAGEAVFFLNCPDGPPELRDNYGFARPGINRILDGLTKALAQLCNEWSQLHGHH